MLKQDEKTTLVERCFEEEEKFQFTRFSQTDAKKLGDLLHKCSLRYDKPVAIEIRMNHLVVYRFFCGSGAGALSAAAGAAPLLSAGGQLWIFLL